MTPAVRLELVAAVAANGVIGRAGTLPWRLPDDLKHFKNLTVGHTVIMGRRTFDELRRKPLPNRRNIVVSRTLDPATPGVELARSLDEASQLAAAQPAHRTFIIGGAVLYREALPTASVLHLTELDAPFEGDTHFPPFDRSQWRVSSESRREKDDRHSTGFWIRTYERA